jgi:hypothetical protein
MGEKLALKGYSGSKRTTHRTTAQTSFAAWCAAGAPWGQCRDLDPEILKWLILLMAKPEAVSIDGVGVWLAWVNAHKTTLRWTTPQQWLRIQLSARAMLKAYQDYLKRMPS